MIIYFLKNYYFFPYLDKIFILVLMSDFCYKSLLYY